MKGKDEIRSENLAKKGIRVINKDVFVFIFFLLLSFVFWYLNFLEKESETGFMFPVKYINLPREKSIIEESSARLNIYLKGPGYLILKMKVSGTRKPLLIDISRTNYKRVPGSKAFNYYIITSQLANSLPGQLRSGCQILSIKPDTLFFTLEKVNTRSEMEKKNSQE